jgi:hypothetical protein
VGSKSKQKKPQSSAFLPTSAASQIVPVDPGIRVKGETLTPAIIGENTHFAQGFSKAKFGNVRC